MNTETNELLNPSFRKGWAGNMQICYPNNYDRERTAPHKNYKPYLSSIYRAGRYVACRGDLMQALNDLLPKPKKKIAVQCSA